MTESNPNDPTGKPPVAKETINAADNSGLGRSASASNREEITQASMPTVVQKGSGKGLSVLAILLSMAALAGTGFTWYQNQVVSVAQESKLSIGVSEIGGQVSRLGDSISRIQQDLANVGNASRFKCAGCGIENSCGFGC